MPYQQSQCTRPDLNGKPSARAGLKSACQRGQLPSWKRERRTFCTAVGWGGVASLFGGTFYVSTQFLSPAVLYEPPSFFRAGKLDQYPQGTVSEHWKDEQQVWIVHTDAGLYSLVATCTHLGCSPNWLPGERVFKCPCHGSTFTLAGDVIAGPAPEPLYRSPGRLAADGQLIIGTGRLGIRLASQANREPKRSSTAYVLPT
jgi:cytochrome b6-f complex iron-sulfur subunit